MTDDGAEESVAVEELDGNDDALVTCGSVSLEEETADGRAELESAVGGEAGEADLSLVLGNDRENDVVVSDLVVEDGLEGVGLGHGGVCVCEEKYDEMDDEKRC